MIPLSSLPQRPYAILGLGLSGLATARALLAAGREVWAWDDNARVRAEAAQSGLSVVDLKDADLHLAEALLLSPGIPHTHPAPHPLALRAREARVPIIGDGELLARAMPAPRRVGITGTNGKSTTTALIGHILAAAGRRCQVGGNLGRPMLDFDPLDDQGIYVIEMSSYQLELMPSLAFDVALLLNITPDHLSRHGGLDGYVAAKRLIFAGDRPGRTAVIGIDDDICLDIARSLEHAGGWRVVPVSTRVPLEGGVFVAGRMVVDAVGSSPSPVFALDEAPALPGEHNAQNAAAAYAACRALGVEAPDIAQAILTFPGLAHRMERIAQVAGVTYVNDSKATNPEAAARALACYRTIYWIAGGRPKEGGLDALDPFLDRIRHAFLIGEAADSFARSLDGRVPLSRSGTLDRAVEAARRQAERDGLPDAVVLLSPACASFDQFRNFEARGDAFRDLVQELPR
jgi:UDP-N-acetylmuramoylalanine--D-glutamate ligase